MSPQTSFLKGAWHTHIICGRRRGSSRHSTEEAEADGRSIPDRFQIADVTSNDGPNRITPTLSGNIMRNPGTVNNFKQAILRVLEAP